MARGLTSYRSPILGTTHMVSAGHYLAAAAGYRILEDGGNAIDVWRGLRHRNQRHPAPRHELRRGCPHRDLRRGFRRRRDHQRAWAVAPRGEHRLLQPARRRPDPHRHSADRHARRGRRLADGPRKVRHDDLRARRHPCAGAGGERLPRIGLPPRRPCRPPRRTTRAASPCGRPPAKSTCRTGGRRVRASSSSSPTWPAPSGG